MATASPTKAVLRLDIVDKLATHIQLRGLTTKGLFTNPPNAIETVIELVDRFRVSKDVNEIQLGILDMRIVAAVLKRYLAIQPEPLLPFDLVAQAYAQLGRKSDHLIKLLSSKTIPTVSRSVLRRLLILIYDLAKNKRTNELSLQFLMQTFSTLVFRQTDPECSAIGAEILTELYNHYGRVLIALPVGESSFRVFGGAPKLSPQDLKILLTNSVVKSFMEGETVFHENEENYSLYMVKCGSLDVIKGGIKLAILRTFDIFGEMSFLGRCRTSASIVANTYSEVIVMKVSFLTQIFAAELELAEKFYWNLAQKLARRMTDLPLTTEGMLEESQSFLDGSLADDDSEETSFIEVHMETIANAWSPCTFRYSTLQTAADLRKTIYSKFPDVNFEAHKFYELQDGRCSVIKHEDGLLLHMKAEQLASNPANQLYFSAAPPQVEERSKFVLAKQVILKEFPCRLKRNGRLYICQKAVAHYSKLFGLEREKVYLISDIHKLVHKELCIIMQLTNSAVYEFVFSETEHAAKALHLINMLKGTLGDHDTPELLRSQSEDLRRSSAAAASLNQQQQEETGLFRARAILAVPKKKPSDLELAKDDTVIVIQKLSEAYWLGKANGSVGQFPAACVDVIFDPANKFFEEAGYVHLYDLPSAADWKLLLAGSKPRTYADGEVLLEQDNYQQRIFQILNGQCRVVLRTSDDTTIELGIMGVDETFGELSFLMGGGASASVIAVGPVEACVIEASYMNRLFHSDLKHIRPGLAARFFKYLATVIERRLRAKEEILTNSGELTPRMRAKSEVPLSSDDLVRMSSGGSGGGSRKAISSSAMLSSSQSDDSFRSLDFPVYVSADGISRSTSSASGSGSPKPPSTLSETTSASTLQTSTEKAKPAIDDAATPAPAAATPAATPTPTPAATAEVTPTVVDATVPAATPATPDSAAPNAPSQPTDAPAALDTSGGAQSSAAQSPAEQGSSSQATIKRTRKISPNSRFVKIDYHGVERDYQLNVSAGEEVFIIHEGARQCLAHTLNGPMGYIPTLHLHPKSYVPTD